MKTTKLKLKLIPFLLISAIFFNCIASSSCINKHFPNGCVKIFFCAQYLSDSNSDLIDVIDAFEQTCKA